MGKNLKLIISVGIWIVILVVWIIAWKNIIKNKNQANQIKQLEQQVDDVEISSDEIDGDSVQAKIDILKKRLSLKWLIQDGDIHFQNEEFTRALAKYLQALKESPNDESIKNKIWNIYFKLHKYEQAYKYYSQIKNYSQLDIHRAIRSLFYSVELNGNKTIFVLEEINSFWLPEDQKFYYKTSIECTKSFVSCKDNFTNYFKNLEGINEPSDEQNETQSWTIQEEKLFINVFHVLMS